MDAPKGEWRKSTARHNLGEDYWLGSVRVGSAFYALTSRGEPPAYRASVDLPGIKVAEAAALKPTMEGAKAVTENVVRAWFTRVSAAPDTGGPAAQVGMEPQSGGMKQDAS